MVCLPDTNLVFTKMDTIKPKDFLMDRYNMKEDVYDGDINIKSKYMREFY